MIERSFPEDTADKRPRLPGRLFLRHVDGLHDVDHRVLPHPGSEAASARGATPFRDAWRFRALPAAGAPLPPLSLFLAVRDSRFVSRAFLSTARTSR